MAVCLLKLGTHLSRHYCGPAGRQSFISEATLRPASRTTPPLQSHHQGSHLTFSLWGTSSLQGHWWLLSAFPLDAWATCCPPSRPGPPESQPVFFVSTPSHLQREPLLCLRSPWMPSARLPLPRHPSRHQIQLCPIFLNHTLRDRSWPHPPNHSISRIKQRRGRPPGK